MKAEQSDDSSASCPPVPGNMCTETGLVTYTSKDNIQEYFARKMKEIQDGKVSKINTNEKESDNVIKKDVEGDVQVKGKKSGKKKRTGKGDKDKRDSCIEAVVPKKGEKKGICEEAFEISEKVKEMGDKEKIELDEVKIKKKKKGGKTVVEKSRKMDNVTEMDVLKKKKKGETWKCKEVNEVDNEMGEPEDDGPVNGKRKKRKRKRMENTDEASEQVECGKIEEMGGLVECNKVEHSKKKKKKKSNKLNNEIDNGNSVKIDLYLLDPNENERNLEAKNKKVKRKKSEKKKSKK